MLAGQKADVMLERGCEERTKVKVVWIRRASGDIARMKGSGGARSARSARSLMAALGMQGKWME